MEKEMDLTLKLGLPNQTVETHLSLNTPTTDQVPTTNQGTTNVVDGGRRDNNNNGGEYFNHLRRALWGDDEVIDDEGARNNVDVNIRVYNYIFQQFAGMGDTLNFAPFPMPTTPSPSPPPAPVTPPVSDYVLIDVPARRAHRNNAMANAWNENANTNANAIRRLRGCGGLCGGRVEGTRKCTNMNCNALTTPMWRRGPLGPKSLCNACGIKFRKEEERKSKRSIE